MTFIEALDKLRWGKKILRKGHAPPREGYAMDTLRVDDLWADDWYVLEEPEVPLLFCEILHGLNSGKRFRRKGRFIIVALSQNKQDFMFSACGAQSLTLDDYRADDWVEVKD